MKDLGQINQNHIHFKLLNFIINSIKSYFLNDSSSKKQKKLSQRHDHINILCYCESKCKMTSIRCVFFLIVRVECNFFSIIQFIAIKSSDEEMKKKAWRERKESEGRKTGKQYWQHLHYSTNKSRALFLSRKMSRS